MSANHSGRSPMLSTWAFEVGAFLGDDDLSVSEQAKLFSPLVLACLWEERARRLLSDSPLWGLDGKVALQRLRDKGVRGKSMLSELRLLRRTFFLPTYWKPWIRPTSFNSLKALPPTLAQGPADDAPQPGPEQAAVAIAMGAFRGRPMVVGMKMVAAGPGPVGDAVHLGVEALSAPELAVSMSVSFAPFSGRCFIQHPWGGPMTRTQALPALHAAPSLSAWLQVTEDGGVRFLRQVDGGKPEEAGLLLPNMCPGWVRENYACVHLWNCGLEAEVHVSVEHSGAAFPAASTVPRACPPEMQTMWELVGGEEQA